MLLRNAVAVSRLHKREVASISNLLRGRRRKPDLGTGFEEGAHVPAVFLQGRLDVDYAYLEAS